MDAINFFINNFFSDSSSSSSEDDEENNTRSGRRTRINNFEDVIDSYSDDEFRRDFRNRSIPGVYVHSEDKEKREIPSLLRKTLAVDAYLTEQFVRTAEKFLFLRQLKVHSKMLEVSCHGIPWIASWIALIWILNSSSLYQMQVNFLIGLFLDIILIALIKSITRRRRPAVNDDPFAIGPDKYSFPSGHASRATFVVYFFFNLWPVNIIFVPPLLAWAVSVCLSRVLMRRHHLLDIIAGVFLGVFEGFFIGLTYLEKDTCIGLISWITDEKLEGGDYHV